MPAPRVSPTCLICPSSLLPSPTAHLIPIEVRRIPLPRLNDARPWCTEASDGPCTARTYKPDTRRPTTHGPKQLRVRPHARRPGPSSCIITRTPKRGSAQETPSELRCRLGKLDLAGRITGPPSYVCMYAQLNKWRIYNTYITWGYSYLTSYLFKLIEYRLFCPVDARAHTCASGRPCVVWVLKCVEL